MTVVSDLKTMSISVKIRKENFEDGEYTPEKYLNKSDVIDFFETFEWVENAEHTTLCLVFTNEAKELFCIEKYSSEVYQLYVIDFSTRYYLHKTTKKTGVINALNKFINNQKFAAEDKFVREADKSFVNSFKARTFIYKTSFLILLEASFPWLIYLVLFFGLSVFSLIIGRSIIFVPILFSMLIFFWLPGLIVHLNYWRHSKATQIKISQGNRNFVITKTGIATSYSKDDIKEIIQYQETGGKSSWAYYGFTRIVFKNNSSVVLTNLIIDQSELRYRKFYPDHIPTEKRRRFFPWFIKRN